MPTQIPVAVPLLHRLLGIGMVAVAVAFVGIGLVLGPLLGEPDEASNLVGYAMGGFALLEGIVALMFMKPRVPERRPGQSVDAYWSDQNIASRVHTVWFMVVGAGILSTVGFALTGHLLPAITMCLAIVVFWMNGPNVFAKP